MLFCSLLHCLSKDILFISIDFTHLSIANNLGKTKLVNVYMFIIACLCSKQNRFYLYEPFYQYETKWFYLYDHKWLSILSRFWC